MKLSYPLAVLSANIIGLTSRQATDFQRGLQVGNAALAAPLLVNSLINWARFSRRREHEVVLLLVAQNKGR